MNRNDLARALMEEFAESSGLTGKTPPRRYLWTDAFAVCNFLGLYRRTGENRYLDLALRLVEQVHHVLGRHRDDDPRAGWISGLSDEEGELHPTAGGLRIGKPQKERAPGEPSDSRREWDQDGQYFHYLTKWMHALHRVAQETGEDRFQRWGVELAMTAHEAFTYELSPGGPKRMRWKMSIDLSRPLVASMGHHDPLDGLITYLELQTLEPPDSEEGARLAHAIAETTKICEGLRWATDDPLGIGGLLDGAARLAQVVFGRGAPRRPLLGQLLEEAEASLQAFAWASPLDQSAERRLAFRELGLAIGLHGLDLMRGLVRPDRELASLVDQLLIHRPLAEQIEAFWSDPARRANRTWSEHGDINAVMLATTLAPESYLRA